MRSSTIWNTAPGALMTLPTFADSTKLVALNNNELFLWFCSHLNEIYSQIYAISDQ